MNLRLTALGKACLTAAVLVLSSTTQQRSTTDAFVVEPSARNAVRQRQSQFSTSQDSSVVVYNIFDNFKSVFSEEARQKRAERERRIVEEQEAAQREILERRRNPELMEKYERDVMERRQKFTNENRRVSTDEAKVARGVNDSDDALARWKQLRQQGPGDVAVDGDSNQASNKKRANI